MLCFATIYKFIFATLQLYTKLILQNSTKLNKKLQTIQKHYIREVIQWKDLGTPDIWPNLPTALRKYREVSTSNH